MVNFMDEKTFIENLNKSISNNYVDQKLFNNENKFFRIKIL